jgi:hypothetical protein
MVAPWFPRSVDVNRVLKPVVFLLAALYFLVDAMFMTVARPLANWIAAHWIFESFAPGLSRCAPIRRSFCLLCL